MTMIDIRNTIPRHPTRKWKKRTKVKKIIVHTTAGSRQDPNEVAKYHIAPNHISSGGCASIVYHDFITKDGDIYHCNNYDDWTWHASAANKTSIGVVMAYRGQDKVHPTTAQWKALIKHLTTLCLFLKISPREILGHRELPWMYTVLGNGSKKYKKLCPGVLVNCNDMRTEVYFKLQQRLRIEGLYRAKIDGLWGPLSQRALDSFDAKGRALEVLQRRKARREKPSES